MKYTEQVEADMIELHNNYPELPVAVKLAHIGFCEYIKRKYTNEKTS